MTIYEQLNNTNRIIIEQIDGDMQLRGQAGPEAIIKGNQAEIETPEDTQQPVRIRCHDDCSLKLPMHLPIHVQYVNGDAKITGLGARLDVDAIQGDAAVRRIDGELVVANIMGDAEIKSIKGNVALTAIHGDAAVSRIDGRVTVGHIGGDMLLRDITGSCNVESVDGDLHVSVYLLPTNTYRFAAASSIQIDMIENSSATFHIPLDVEVMIRGVNDDNVQRTEDLENGLQIITLGSEGAAIHINDADELMINVGQAPVSEFNLDLEFGGQLAELEGELNERFADLGKMIEDQAKAFASASARAVENLDIEATMDRVRRRTERGVERVQQRAQQRVQRAQERAQRAQERAQRFTERHAERARRFEQRQPPTPPSEPVRDEERLLILQMVQDGKISIEEAERLLTTLESS